jgi:AcrR family transcriptional regulator
MAAIGTQGFRELTHAMRRASDNQPDPLDALKRAGIAYITFALCRPEHFMVMFDAPESDGSEHPDLGAAGKEAFDTLLNLVKRCQQEGLLPAGDPQAYALLAWTMVYGVAKLAITRRLRLKSRGEMLKFAEFVIDQSRPRAARP